MAKSWQKTLEYHLKLSKTAPSSKSRNYHDTVAWQMSVNNNFLSTEKKKAIYKSSK